MDRRVAAVRVTRRALLVGAPVVVGWTERAAAQRLLSQQDAGYRDTPNGVQMCGTCTLFVRPNTCKVVDGQVQRTGWCRLYDMTD